MKNVNTENQEVDSSAVMSAQFDNVKIKISRET